MEILKPTLREKQLVQLVGERVQLLAKIGTGKVTPGVTLDTTNRIAAVKSKVEQSVHRRTEKARTLERKRYAQLPPEALQNDLEKLQKHVENGYASPNGLAEFTIVYSDIRTSPPHPLAPKETPGPTISALTEHTISSPINPNNTIQPAAPMPRNHEDSTLLYSPVREPGVPTGSKTQGEGSRTSRRQRAATPMINVSLKPDIQTNNSSERKNGIVSIRLEDAVRLSVQVLHANNARHANFRLSKKITNSANETITAFRATGAPRLPANPEKLRGVLTLVMERFSSMARERVQYKDPDKNDPIQKLISALYADPDMILHEITLAFITQNKRTLSHADQSKMTNLCFRYKQEMEEFAIAKGKR